MAKKKPRDAWHLAREAADLRRQLTALSRDNMQLRQSVRAIEAARTEAAQWSALPERMERIRLIIEEICDHHGLTGALRTELFQAVHMARAPRILNTYFHVRVAEPDWIMH